MGVRQMSIPADGRDWDVRVGRPTALATTLQDRWKDALMFRDLATLRIDRSLVDRAEQLRWRGPTEAFAEISARIDGDGLPQRAADLAAKHLG